MTNDSKSTETFKDYKDSKFPTVNPHERPFQSLSSFDAHKLHDSSLSMTRGSGGGGGSQVHRGEEGEGEKGEESEGKDCE